MPPDLPELLAITGPANSEQDFCIRLAEMLTARPGGVVFRARNLPQAQWHRRRDAAWELCRAANVPLIVAAAVGHSPNEQPPQADGLHLSSTDLLHTECRPPDIGLLGASCHSPAELRAARLLGCDYAFVSPVFSGKSDRADVPAGQTALGLAGLTEMIAEEPEIAVYALGGMSPKHLAEVQACGAQGIAGIRWCWPS